MTKTTDITTISQDNLHRIVGGQLVGGAGPNRDSQTDSLGGVLFDRQSTTRSDDAYRLDATRQACRQLHTSQERTWYGGTRDVVNEPRAAQCLLNSINPTQPAPNP
jgi:hypothetical protein